MDTEKSIILLQAMQQHELTIAKLYLAYAERFEAEAEFWNELSEAEVRHSRCLQKVKDLMADNPEIQIAQRFSLDAINSSIRYINELIERAASPEFQPINALSLAMKLEEAFLEKNYFEVLTGDSEEIKDTLELLRSETEQHFHILKEKVDRFKLHGR